MSDDINDLIEMTQIDMDETIEHLDKELRKIRTGKASPSILSGIFVEYYGNPTPIGQVSNIGTADARTITIQPWEKGMLANIEQAIFAANLGLTPMNDGEYIRINIPPLTEERRKSLVKQAKKVGEEAKIGLRTARQKAMDTIKKEVKDGYPEDLGKRREGEVQAAVNDSTEKINKMIEAKEKDIMTI